MGAAWPAASGARAIRLTDSGESTDAAPWATGRLGRSKGSHGCINVSDADAGMVVPAPPVRRPLITRVTTRAMEPDNGAGGVWNIPWDTWLTGHTT